MFSFQKTIKETALDLYYQVFFIILLFVIIVYTYYFEFSNCFLDADSTSLCMELR